MKRNFTRLASIWVGLPFVCAPLLTGQTVRVEKAQSVEQVKEIRQRRSELPETREQRRLQDVQLRAASIPWPDSTVTYTVAGERQSKSVYTYDAAGNQTLSESFKWEGNKWVNTSKYAYTYDAAGNRTLYEYFNWDGNKWVNSSKFVYAYDAAGNQTLYEYYRWENNQWTGLSKYTYAYNSRGVETLSVNYGWTNNQWEKVRENHFDRKAANAKVYVYTSVFYFHDESWGQWPKAIFVSDPYGTINTAAVFSEGLKLEYKATYDANDNLTLIETSYLWEGQRVPDMKYIIKYENNNPVSLEEYDMSDNNNRLNRKGSYTYDARGNITLYESYEWDYEKKQMVGVYKIVRTYDANGKELSYEFYEGVTASGSWIGYYKETYMYDANGNRLSFELYDWNTSSGSWIGRYKYTYERNERGDIIAENYYLWQNNGWEWTSYMVSYPGGNPNATEGISAATTDVWSYDGVLHVRTAQPSAWLKIYTLSGALLRQQTLSAGETTVALPQGVYIVQAGDTVTKVAIGR
jgi:hypothetical protein